MPGFATEPSGLASTVITSQFSVASWHEIIGDLTITDAICDRIANSSNSYSYNIKVTI